jgi:hypothetical protein
MIKVNATLQERFSVVVVYRLKNGHKQAFLELALDHAVSTLRDNEECLQYDVVVMTDDCVFFMKYTYVKRHTVGTFEVPNSPPFEKLD